MPDQPLVARPLQSTPPDVRSAPGGVLGLPRDLQRDMARRLGIMSLVGAVLWVIAPAADHLSRAASHGDPTWMYPDATDGIALVSVLLSVALYFYTRMKEDRPRLIGNVGLAYMVWTSLALGLMMHWGPLPEGVVSIFPILTWIGPVVLMFAALVPTTPGRMLMVGLVAAAMNPLGMILGRMRGVAVYGSLTDVVIMHYPDFMVIGVAVVISHVVSNLGREVRKARELGSYQLGELLGRGGMGEVYVATHRLLARSAAIKLIRPEMIRGDGEGTQVAVRRFHREAQVAATLRSPHTVELYDFGVTEDQTLYFVMELLDGLDLETLVRRFGPVPADRTIHILRQVCASLSEAHARGLVHRDIKPANLHIGTLGLEYDFVKVLDFGLVKSVAGTTGEHSMATVAGVTPGTPAYMAPEVALGEVVDGRADLYAVGCVGYFLLTGQLVFEGGTPLQMIARHLQDSPVPPSRRTEIAIPAGLEQVILACLAKKPEHRPASAELLRGRLAQVDVSSAWSQERAEQWWRLNQPDQMRPVSARNP